MEQLGFIFVLGPSWHNYWYPEGALSHRKFGNLQSKKQNKTKSGVLISMSKEKSNLNVY